MRLTQKSRALIEILLLTGLDVFTATNRMSGLYKGIGNWEDDYNGQRHLKRLKEKGWIVWDDSRETGSWVAKITEESKEQLAGSLDPEKLWNEKWDGIWRTMTFDLPQNEKAERKRLDSWLTKNRFGHLQGSVRITPRPYRFWTRQLAKMNIDPTAVFFMEGSPLGKAGPREIVSKAWDFEQINKRHSDYLRFHNKTKPAAKSDLSPQERFLNWYKVESTLWKTTIEADPLLPSELQPEKYKGQESWKTRKASYQAWSRILRD